MKYYEWMNKLMGRKIPEQAFEIKYVSLSRPQIKALAAEVADQIKMSVEDWSTAEICEIAILAAQKIYEKH